MAIESKHKLKGSGSYGLFYELFDNPTDGIKITSFDTEDCSSLSYANLREAIASYSIFNHKNLIKPNSISIIESTNMLIKTKFDQLDKLNDLACKNGKLYLIQMPKANGDLTHLYKLNISERILLFPTLVRDLVNGLFEISRKGFVHGDFKAPNVYYFIENQQYKFTIGDFGGLLNTNIPSIPMCSPDLCPPEYLFNNSNYHTKISKSFDIYSLGATLANFLFGNHIAGNSYKAHINYLTFHRKYVPPTDSVFSYNASIEYIEDIHTLDAFSFDLLRNYLKLIDLMTHTNYHSRISNFDEIKIFINFIFPDTFEYSIPLKEPKNELEEKYESNLEPEIIQLIQFLTYKYSKPFLIKSAFINTIRYFEKKKLINENADEKLFSFSEIVNICKCISYILSTFYYSSTKYFEAEEFGWMTSIKNNNANKLTEIYKNKIKDILLTLQFNIYDPSLLDYSIYNETTEKYNTYIFESFTTELPTKDGCLKNNYSLKLKVIEDFIDFYSKLYKTEFSTDELKVTIYKKLARVSSILDYYLSKNPLFGINVLLMKQRMFFATLIEAIPANENNINLFYKNNDTVLISFDTFVTTVMNDIISTPELMNPETLLDLSDLSNATITEIETLFLIHCLVDKPISDKNVESLIEILKKHKIQSKKFEHIISHLIGKTQESNL